MGGHGKEIPQRQIKLGALGFPAHGYRGLGGSLAVWISEEPEGAWSQEGGKRRYRGGQRGRRLKWQEDRGRSVSSVVWGGVRVEIRKPGQCVGGAQEAGLTTARSSPSSTQVCGRGEGSGARSQLGAGGAQTQGLTAGGCCQV